jgi:hypothetical protein
MSRRLFDVAQPIASTERSQISRSGVTIAIAPAGKMTVP